MTLKELPYQDGINWTELEGKPAIFNWNGKPMAGTLYLDGFSNLVVRELPGYMPVLYVWPVDFLPRLKSGDSSPRGEGFLWV